MEIKAAPAKRKTQGSTRSKARAGRGAKGDHTACFMSCMHCRTAGKPRSPLPQSQAASPAVPWLLAGPSQRVLGAEPSLLAAAGARTSSTTGLTCSWSEGHGPGAAGVDGGQRRHVGRRGPGLDLHFHGRSGHHWHPLLTSNCTKRRWQGLVTVPDTHFPAQHAGNSCKGEDKSWGKSRKAPMLLWRAPSWGQAPGVMSVVSVLTIPIS